MQYKVKIYLDYTCHRERTVRLWKSLNNGSMESYEYTYLLDYWVKNIFLPKNINYKNFTLFINELLQKVNKLPQKCILDWLTRPTLIN